jgi:hypothetical protein
LNFYKQSTINNKVNDKFTVDSNTILDNIKNVLLGISEGTFRKENNLIGTAGNQTH